MTLRLQLILIVISILQDMDIFFVFPFESSFVAAHLQVVVYVSWQKLV